VTRKAVTTVTGDDPDHVVRLVTRCVDMLGPPTPGAVRNRCGRCNHLVWVDATQKIPPAYQTAWIELVCVPCALTDPDLRPDVIALYQAVGRFAAVQKQAEQARQQRRRAVRRVT
jgi:hypothetical protein